MPRRCDLSPLQLGQRPDARAVLAADEHVARPVVGPRVEDLARQRLVVGDGVGVDGLAEDEVAPSLEQLAHRGLAVDVEPVDPELQTPSRSARARASSTSSPGRSSRAAE